MPSADSEADSATALVAMIWPVANINTALPNKVISLRFYIRETLRRSRTSYSTLQVTLWYLVLIRPFVLEAQQAESTRRVRGDVEDIEKPECTQPSCALLCGRRMFLSALILASKYLQDRNFTTRAWSKITGLPAKDIVSNENMFLSKINWTLHMAEVKFKYWNAIILSCTDSTRLGRSLHDTWLFVAKSVKAGKGLEQVAHSLSIQRQHLVPKAQTSPCEMAYGLLTPSTSFGPSAEGVHSDNEDSSFPHVESSDSPAMSMGGESILSDLSVRDLQAAAPSCDAAPDLQSPPATGNYSQQNSTRDYSRSFNPNSSTLAATNFISSAWESPCSGQGSLPTPPTSSCYTRCDKDGQANHSSPARYKPTESCESARNVEGLAISVGSEPLISTPHKSIERSRQLQSVDDSRYHSNKVSSATKQEPLSMHMRSDHRLLKQSIAHWTLPTPAAVIGTKRSADTLSTPDAPKSHNLAKMRCLTQMCETFAAQSASQCARAVKQ